MVGGVLRYMKPDKGLFRVDDILFYKPSPDNGQAKYEAIQDRYGDYWVCDGKSVHIYERNEKKVKRYDLPPEMQGVGIYQSPLPFLFGVKSQEVQTRILDPSGSTRERLANRSLAGSLPQKSSRCCASYLKVLVVLDAKEVLPKVLVVFDPNYTQQNPQRTVFEFTDREKNWSFADRINEMNWFKEEFIPAAPPKDWKIEVTPIQSQRKAHNPESQILSKQPNRVR
jgi:TIGR03009 family protein